MQKPEPDLELVTVLEACDPLVMGAAKGLLEDAGIPYFLIGQEIGARYGPVGPFLNRWCRFQVGADRAAEARELLAQFEGDDRGRS